VGDIEALLGQDDPARERNERQRQLRPVDAGGADGDLEAVAGLRLAPDAQKLVAVDLEPPAELPAQAREAQPAPGVWAQPDASSRQPPGVVARTGSPSSVRATSCQLVLTRSTPSSQLVSPT